MADIQPGIGEAIASIASALCCQSGYKLTRAVSGRYANTELFREGHDVNVIAWRSIGVLLRSLQAKQLPPCGAENWKDCSKRGDAFAESDRCAGIGVKGFVAVHDPCRPFQNEDMLVLILMNVHRRAVTSIRDDLNDRIGVPCVRGGYAD
jgi:hypothetical protein